MGQLSVGVQGQESSFGIQSSDPALVFLDKIVFADMRE